MYESKKTKRRDFTWEKNVDEMNGKRTCPRLLGRKKKKKRIGPGTLEQKRNRR